MPTIKGRKGRVLGEEGMWLMPVNLAPLESFNVKGLKFEAGCVMEDISPISSPDLVVGDQFQARSREERNC